MAPARVEIPARFKLSGSLGGIAMILTAFAVLARVAFDPSLARPVATIATITAALSSVVHLSQFAFLDHWWRPFLQAIPAFRSHLRRHAIDNSLLAISFFGVSALLLTTSP